MTLQPISTAPKDGRYILLFGPSGYLAPSLICVVAKHVTEPAKRWIDHAGFTICSAFHAPTHWAELPEAPKSEREQLIDGIGKWVELWDQAPVGTQRSIDEARFHSLIRNTLAYLKGEQE